MSFVDKTIQCVQCGASFAFTASEQQLFSSKGFTNEPKRCPDCRQARRQQTRLSSDSYGDGMQRRREMYPAVCASCGKETQVPFQPRNGRPVYCSDCYSKVRR